MTSWQSVQMPSNHIIGQNKKLFVTIGSYSYIGIFCDKELLHNSIIAKNPYSCYFLLQGQGPCYQMLAQFQLSFCAPNHCIWRNFSTSNCWLPEKKVSKSLTLVCSNMNGHVVSWVGRVTWNMNNGIFSLGLSSQIFGVPARQQGKKTF